ncbi:MAG: hypothetical protein LBP76_07595 [Treponema sp.]|jgi:hypothetical protein|nr:hypothetical protein [Treponema sp.]
MKKTIPLFLVVVCGLMACGNATLYKDSGDPPYVPSNDADFLSFTGIRQETYYLWPDPVLHDDPISLSLSAQLSIYDSFSGTTQIRHNRANFTVPFKATIYPGYYTVSASGTIVVPGLLGGGIESTYSNTKTIYLSGINTSVIEEYDVEESFDSSSMVLPMNGYPVDAYFLTFRTKIFNFSLDSQQFLDLATPHSPVSYDTLHTAVSSSPFNRTDPYRLASREFYRYKSFTLTYPADARIFAPLPEAIVQTFSLDPDTHSLSVTLVEYNAPFSGKVLTYWIQAEDGTVREKIISIGS